MRLTADGRFRPCLLRRHEIEVGAALRAGAGVTQVASLLARAIAARPAVRPRRRLEVGGRAMAAIGG
jgi:cyclic pyranopterin phosphate synthase